MVLLFSARKASSLSLLFPVEEVDPTELAIATVLIFIGLPGATLGEVGLANAVGALAVTKKGPMEGAPTQEELEEFLKKF